MKKVEFVRIKYELTGRFIKRTDYSFAGAEKIIKERIENGWSFEGYIPIDMKGNGSVVTISLIFQKDE